MAEEVYMTPEERLQELSDIIISGVVGVDEMSKERRRVLISELPVRCFFNENFVIYSVLYQFRDKGITPDTDFMKMYLMRSTNFFKKNREYIDMSGYTEGEDDGQYTGFISSVVNQYVRLQGTGVSSPMDEFRLNIEKYRTEYSAIEMNKAYAMGRQILYEGMEIGRRYYQGFDDSIAYVKKVAADIDNMLSNSVDNGFVDSRTEGVIDKEEAEHVKVCDFDLINELNEYLDGIYTGFLYNIVAPTKGGKSKFMSRLVHTAVVQYGQDVSIWAFEGGKNAFWAQMRAIHYEYTYIRNAVSGDRVVPLSQEDILLGRYPSETVRQLEEVSRVDLFTNPSYGNMNMINRPFKTETFIDEIDTSVKLNKSTAVFIDYLQLIQTDMRGVSGTENLRTAYQKALQYTKEKNVAIVTPAQYKQEFIKEMASYKGGSAPETRIAGGESAEVIRSSDYNIALYASIDDLTRNEMTIMSIPARFSKTFPAFQIYADLCCCVFSSLEE